MKYQLSSTAHFLTVDVAEWYSDPAVAAVVSPTSAAALPHRAADVIPRLMKDIAANRSSATFFVAAAVAERNADLVRRMVGAGHEVAVLGNYSGADRDEFRSDARQAKAALESVSGARVTGFRSATSSPFASWRFECLAEEGFEYDSTRVWGKHVDGQVPGYARTILCGAGTLIEVPREPGPLAGTPLSVRRLPYSTLKTTYAERTRAGLPGVVSFASWEVDDEQPRHRLPVLTSLRHYSGRRAARERVSRLLQDFRFDAIGHRLSDLAKDAPAAFAA